MGKTAIGFVNYETPSIAKKLSPSSIIPLNNNKWKVRHLNMLGTLYVIESYWEDMIVKVCAVTVKCFHMLTHVHV